MKPPEYHVLEEIIVSYACDFMLEGETIERKEFIIKNCYQFASQLLEECGVSPSIVARLWNYEPTDPEGPPPF